MKIKQLSSLLRLSAVAFFMLFATNTFAQSNKVSGSVKDSNGEPAIGATIRVKGTNTVAITDVNGNYTIECEPNQTLQIEYIGFDTQEVKVGNKRQINAELKQGSTDLDEVVVVGYGTVRKADLAGSVSTMDRKAFKDQPVVDLSETLQGRMAGVYVENAGVPGGDFKIRIRGANSVNKSNDPLYVVDGVVRESGVDGINPDDIKSIQVLKDASSTAIYGARGANGVVLIETKGGVAGHTDINFNATLGISKLPKKLNTLNAQEYAQILVEQGYDKNALTNYLNGSDEGTDWQDQIFQTGVTQDYRLAISSGNEDTQYRISGNYTDREGIVVGTDFKRYNAKANITSKVAKWLTVHADLGATHMDIKGNGMKLGGDNPIFLANNYAPTMHVQDENGNYNKSPYGAIDPSPYGNLVENQNDRVANVFNGMIELKFNIVKGLTFTTTNGVDYRNFKGYTFSTTRVNTSNSMSNSDTSRMQLQSSNNLTYVGNWGNHHLTATGVWEATSNETRYMQLSGSNLQSESVGYWNYSLANTRNGSNSYSKWTMLSGVGRLMYNFADRYLLTGTIRADGSSRFTNKKWGYFPSAAVAWTVSNEPFMKNCTALSNFKIRASWGIVGNQAIDPYSTLGLLSKTSFNFGTSTSYTGYWENTVATPDLTWEKTKQIDFGIDLGLWNGRLDITADVFYKKTTDALLTYQSAYYIGGSTYSVNQGEISNKGIDLAISANIIQTKNFFWNSSITGTYLKNKVEKLAGGDNDYFFGSKPAGGMTVEPTIIKPGYAIGSFYGYRWAGVNSDGQSLYYTKNGSTTTTPAGDDREVIGKASPDVTIGWNNRFTYKNWEFNAFINSALGGKRLNLLRYAMACEPGSAQTITLKDAITESGVNYQKYTVGDNTQPISTQFLESNNYVRLDNISVAYTFKESRNHFADIRIALSAQNLVCLTGYKGYDPTGFTATNGGHADVDAGIDVGSYPNPRSFTANVSFTWPIKKKAKVERVEPQVVKEIVEKIVEKPVEKIVEKEVIKEVVKNNISDGMYVVNFALGSSKVDETEELDKIPAGSTVEICAYASPEGNPEANQVLSQKRADNIAKYLEGRGVKVDRAIAKGANSKRSNRIAIVTVK